MKIECPFTANFERMKEAKKKFEEYISSRGEQLEEL